MFLGTKEEPSLQYEKLRRKIKNGVSELWYFVSAQIKLAQKQAQDMSPQLATRLNRILDEGVEHKRYELFDILDCVCVCVVSSENCFC